MPLYGNVRRHDGLRLVKLLNIQNDTLFELSKHENIKSYFEINDNFDLTQKIPYTKNIRCYVLSIGCRLQYV